MAIYNQFKTAILLGLLTALLLWVGQAIGGVQGLTFALIFSVAMNFGMYFFSHKIVLAMYGAKEVKEKDNPKLYKMVRGVSQKAGLPMPKVYITQIMTPNAFATGPNYKKGCVCFTQGILNLLDEHELKGVAAHELAHIKNRDTLISTVAATIAGVISYVAMMARYAAIFGGSRDRNRGNGIELLVLAIITPLIATLIQLAISRSREYLADSTGAGILKDSSGLSTGLQKLHEGVKRNPLGVHSTTESTAHLFIVNPFSAKGFISLFMTHPPMEERVKRLKSMRF